MRKITLLLSFFLMSPAILLISIVLYSLISFQTTHTEILASTDNKAYASMLTDVAPEKDSLTPDQRVAVLEEFFQKHKSPLASYGDEIVTVSDKYGIDYRLLPAIAMQESNLCKKAPKNSYNCWGYAAYNQKFKYFEGFETAIEAVGATLAENYVYKGYQTPEQIMTKYAPNSNGSWAKAINFFMDQLTI